LQDSSALLVCVDISYFVKNLRKYSERTNVLQLKAINQTDEIIPNILHTTAQVRIHLVYLKQ
jgi:hypothetical protein